jgi:hypothetical protein
MNGSDDDPLKFQALKEIVCLVGADAPQISDDDVVQLFNLVKANLIRESVQMPGKDMLAGLRDFPRDKAWPQLELVYRILGRLERLFPQHAEFNLDLLRQLLQLLGTPDPDERLELIQFFKSYVVKHPSHVGHICSKLFDLIRIHTETEEKPIEVLNALPILLNTFELIASGSDRIEEVILPLLRDRYLECFQLDLINVLQFFVSDQPENAAKAVRYILRHWPTMRVQKICTLTIILFDCLAKLSSKDQTELLPAALRILAANCNSPSPKLAELSLAFFLSPEFESLMADHSKTMLDILVPGVIVAAQQNWDAAIRERAIVALAIMSNMEPEHVRAVSVSCMNHQTDPTLETKRNQWEMIIDACEGKVSGLLGKTEEMAEVFQLDVEVDDDW